MYSTQQGSDLLRRIDEANNHLKTTVAGLTNAQSSFKPSPGAWSVDGIVEHLAIVQERVIGRVDQLLVSTPDPSQKKDPQLTDEVLTAKVADRSSKFPAPEVSHPTGQSLSDSLARLTLGRQRVAELVASLPPDFQQRTMPHPVFGPLDCHQWLLALAAHCVRHTKQIIETKSSANFPAH
jgi:hypothetical protein